MRAYKYRLKPPAKIIAIFESWLVLLCELYNAALQERRDAYRINHLSINYKAQANQLPEIKNDRPEFANIHSQVIRAEMDLKKAQRRVSRRVRWSNGRRESIAARNAGWRHIGIEMAQKE